MDGETNGEMDNALYIVMLDTRVWNRARGDK